MLSPQFESKKDTGKSGSGKGKLVETGTDPIDELVLPPLKVDMATSMKSGGHHLVDQIIQTSDKSNLRYAVHANDEEAAGQARFQN